MWNLARSKTGYMFLVVTLFSSGPALALTVYTDHAQFVTANAGLVTEDFETNNVSPTSTQVCSSPVDSNTDNACFNPGNLLPSVVYGLPDTPVGDKLNLLRANDPLTFRLGANSNQDYLVLQFSGSNITAVGLELICSSSPRNGTVRFYGTSGLITEEPVFCSATGTFIGLHSDENIIRVEAEAPGTWELIDNVIFGSPVVFTTFDSRDTFTSTYPILSLVDFESGNLGGNLSTTCPTPLAVQTDNECFSSGDVPPGVEIRLQENPALDLFILAEVPEGPSNVLGPVSGSDYLYIRFSDSQTKAVGLDVYCIHNPGQASVRFYSTTAVFAELAFDCTETSTFVGLAADKHIDHIEVEQPGNLEFIDNVLFGRAVMELMFKDNFE